MKDELDDDDQGALIIGIGGPPKDELDGGEGGELKPLMAALARALKHGNFGKAARIFAEAVHVCDDVDDDDDDAFGAGKKRGSSDDDEDDYLS
jgi:hypothetical protein